MQKCQYLNLKKLRCPVTPFKSLFVLYYSFSSNFYLILVAEIKKSLAWLEHIRTPLSELSKHYRVTAIKRYNLLLEQRDQSNEKATLSKYNFLKEQEVGPKLIDIEFVEIYQAKGQLLSEFASFFAKLYKQTASKLEDSAELTQWKAIISNKETQDRKLINFYNFINS